MSMSISYSQKLFLHCKRFLIIPVFPSSRSVISLKFYETYREFEIHLNICTHTNVQRILHMAITHVLS